MRRLVTVHRSPRREGMYLYVDRLQGLQDVPATLLERFGAPEEVMTLALTPERKLARASAVEVLERIDSQGFYLQMPPSALEPDDGCAVSE